MSEKETALPSCGSQTIKVENIGLTMKVTDASNGQPGQDITVDCEAALDLGSGGTPWLKLKDTVMPITVAISPNGFLGISIRRLGPNPPFVLIRWNCTSTISGAVDLEFLLTPRH